MCASLYFLPYIYLYKCKYLQYFTRSCVRVQQFSVCRLLPALGESLATLVGAMPVAFLEPHLNAHNPLSVFNTKTPRERASECPAQLPLAELQPRSSLTDLFCSSPEHARHGGGDVSGDASAGQTAQRRQRHLWLWSTLQRHAAGVGGGGGGWSHSHPGFPLSQGKLREMWKDLSWFNTKLDKMLYLR